LLLLTLLLGGFGGGLFAVDEGLAVGVRGVGGFYYWVVGELDGGIEGGGGGDGNGLFFRREVGAGFELGVGLFDLGAVDEGLFDFLVCWVGGLATFVCVCPWFRDGRRTFALVDSVGQVLRSYGEAAFGFLVGALIAVCCG
jgi:hypothetical protein